MSNKLEFKGIFTALITPFKNGEIDQSSFVKLIKDQEKAGIEGVVIAGTTGEAATLSFAEKIRLITIARENSNGIIKIIVGTGSNNTKEAIELSKEAEKAGSDGLIIVTPYYNRPSQEGLYLHYKAINDEVNIPIMLYTVPKRTGIDFSDETIIRLSKLQNITAIKDSTDDLTKPTRLINQVASGFSFISGDDANIVSYSINGGVGCVSVASNIIPAEILKIQSFINNQDYDNAKSHVQKLVHLFNVMFCETNPTPIKYAASLLNICEAEVRLPLTVPLEQSCLNIKNVLKEMGLIEDLSPTKSKLILV